MVARISLLWSPGREREATTHGGTGVTGSFGTSFSYAVWVPSVRWNITRYSPQTHSWRLPTRDNSFTLEYFNAKIDWSHQSWWVSMVMKHDQRYRSIAISHYRHKDRSAQEKVTVGTCVGGSSRDPIRGAGSESISSSVVFVSDSVTPWTKTCQAPLSMEFSRQEY